MRPATGYINDFSHLLMNFNRMTFPLITYAMWQSMNFTKGEGVLSQYGDVAGNLINGWRYEESSIKNQYCLEAPRVWLIVLPLVDGPWRSGGPPKLIENRRTKYSCGAFPRENVANHCCSCNWCTIAVPMILLSGHFQSINAHHFMGRGPQYRKIFLASTLARYKCRHYSTNMTVYLRTTRWLWHARHDMFNIMGKHR